MISTRYIQKLICLIFICAFNSAYAAVLDVPKKFQEKDQWCWAGVSQAILNYYNFKISQTAIAQYGTEGANIWNWLYGSSSDPNRRGINLILDNWGVANSYGYYILSKTRIQNEINSGQPFVIRWGWDTGGGHFVVGRGIENNDIYIMDPWPGNGYSINNYDWIVSGGGHTWTHTLETKQSFITISLSSAFIVYMQEFANLEINIKYQNPDNSTADKIICKWKIETEVTNKNGSTKFLTLLKGKFKQKDVPANSLLEFRKDITEKLNKKLQKKKFADLPYNEKIPARIIVDLKGKIHDKKGLINNSNVYSISFYKSWPLSENNLP